MVSSSGPEPSPSENVAARMPADAAAAEPVPIDAGIDWSAWTIEPARVGAVELGKRVPDALLGPGLEQRYEAIYIADGQPVDVFRFDVPPIMLVLAKGPWRTAGRKADPAGPPPADQHRAKAVELARQGVEVRAVIVLEPGPKTEAGVGVGSSLDELERAYPDLKLRPFPEVLGDDACVGRTKSLADVAFVFSDCRKAKQGEPVRRVDLWPKT
jgi:hypothetical protein